MAKVVESFVEVEFDTEKNSNWMFRPLQRRIRGRFDVLRCTEPNAGKLRNQWPEPIPGQRLRIDFNERAGYIVEPLHFPEHLQTRERLSHQGLNIEPEIQRFDEIDCATWAYWIRSAIEAGKACIVDGDLPDQASFHSEPRKRFYSNEPEPDKSDAILERLVVALEKLAN